jgi:prepilin-type N-terminal cleavage/methylation domain-containing protein
MKKAFTLIELTFALVIMSIAVVMSAGYIGYIYDDLMDKSELASANDEAKTATKTIVKLLEKSIKESIVLVDGSNYNSCQSINQNTIFSNPTIVWIGIDNKDFLGSWKNGYYQPNWSGVINQALSSTNSITDPLSDFATLKNALQEMNGPNYSIGVYIESSSSDSCNDFYANGGAKIFEATANNNTISFTNKKPEKLAQRYALSSGAYAIAIENGSELVMYYDFYPWKNEPYTTGKHSILGKNIDSFAIKSDNGLIRINICAKIKSQTGQVACYEDAVF